MKCLMDNKRNKSALFVSWVFNVYILQMTALIHYCLTIRSVDSQPVTWCFFWSLNQTAPLEGRKQASSHDFYFGIIQEIIISYNP